MLRVFVYEVPSTKSDPVVVSIEGCINTTTDIFLLVGNHATISSLPVMLSSQACKDGKTNSRFFGTKHSIDWKFVVSSICMVHTALLEWTWTKNMGLQQSVSTSSLCVPLLQVREDFLCGSCWTQKPLLLRENHRGDLLWGPMVLRQTAAWYSIPKKKSSDFSTRVALLGMITYPSTKRHL